MVIVLPCTLQEPVRPREGPWVGRQGGSSLEGTAWVTGPGCNCTCSPELHPALLTDQLGRS